MPIDFNKIRGSRTESEPQRAPQKGQQSGGINFDAINKRESEQPSSKLSLLARFKENKAAKRARLAAENAAVIKAHQIEEKKRQEGMEIARSRIQSIIETGDDFEPVGVPGIDSGLIKTIEWMAKNNPQKALEEATAYVGEIQDHNHSIPKRRAEYKARMVKVNDEKEKLKNYPVRIAGYTPKPKSPQEPLFNRIISKPVNTFGFVGNLLSRGLAATLSNEPKTFLNEISLTDAGLRTFAPNSQVSRAEYKPEEVGDRVRLSVNPPRWLDWVYGLAETYYSFRKNPLNSKESREKVNRLIPVGQVVAFEPAGATLVGAAPTFFPGKKLQKLEEALSMVRKPPKPDLEYKAQPSIEYILKRAASAAGVEPPKIEQDNNYTDVAQDNPNKPDSYSMFE